MKTLLCILGAWVAPLALIAQVQNVPSAHQEDNGPSLEATMNFIQEKLSAQGTINWITAVQDTVTGATIMPASPQSEAKSEVVANPRSCKLSYHVKGTLGGRTVLDKGSFISFKNVDKIEVMTLDNYHNRNNAKQGHPERMESDSPTVYIVAIGFTDVPGGTGWIVSEQDMANRIANAMFRAAQLCGSEVKSEPF